jgi:hypothetical protein
MPRALPQGIPEVGFRSFSGYCPHEYHPFELIIKPQIQTRLRQLEESSNLVFLLFFETKLSRCLFSVMQTYINEKISIKLR